MRCNNYLIVLYLMIFASQFSPTGAIGDDRSPIQTPDISKQPVGDQEGALRNKSSTDFRIPRPPIDLRKPAQPSQPWIWLSGIGRWLKDWWWAILIALIVGAICINDWREEAARRHTNGPDYLDPRGRS